MIENAMLLGESKNIEYKRMLPDKSEKYMKTIVAFANTQGGKLLIGIDDISHQIVGVDGAKLFEIMDQIANAVSDSCEPQIIPDIEPLTVEGKNIIVISVEAGKNRPYYLKSQGKDNGTYIRVAGTSRPAFPEKIKELEMEGSRISWDELTCVGYPVTDELIEKLCEDIGRFRQKAGMKEHVVTKDQLISWKILKLVSGRLVATNAFALLTSSYFTFAKTQCAVFKGEDRSFFLDKREFTGPIYSQIENGLEFVLRNIRLGASIDGLVRKEKYELPPEAIREMIINAHCHRNYLDESCIQIAIFDDRLEITSPGGLYNGLTYEEVMQGHSKIRNKAIANVFGQMGLVEAWGSGIKRIFRSAKEYGLSDPIIQEFDNMFRIELYRNRKADQVTDQADQVTDQADQVTDQVTDQANQAIKSVDYIATFKNLSQEEKDIIILIESKPVITQREIASELNWNLSRVKYYISKMKEKNILEREGTSQKGKWVVKSA